MRKHSLLVIMLLQNIILFGQGASTPDIKLDLPTIIPPSPTVAALMKFEEVPVSNYTGVPDVSIPLFSSATHSKDIGMDISLKYHPSNVAALERASDVGLGWSLFAGGSVSRTVKGMPDEILEMGDKAKIGLYQNAPGNYKNNYYYIANELNDENTSAFDAIDEYLWDAQVRGRLDTEHDLWQFSFMGNSGRFYIKKDALNHLVVTPLDEYRVKINNFNNDPYNAYKPTSFEIFDEKGYKYIFDVAETTTVHTSTASVSSTSFDHSDLIDGGSVTYTSAFHLTKVLDNAGNILIEILYKPGLLEVTSDQSTTYYNEDYLLNIYSPHDFYTSGPCGEAAQNFNPYPTYSSTISQRNTTVRKILQVKVTGIAKIDFEYTAGRDDSNYHASGTYHIFSGITVKDWNDTVIKKAFVEQGYSTTIATRLMLTKVSFKNPAGTLSEDYSFEYRENSSPGGPNYIGVDYWGYYNLRPPFYSAFHPGFQFKDPDPQFGTTELLQKMTYPTGGCAIFDWKANTYSYDGSTELPSADFDANPDNWDPQSEGITFGPTTTPSTVAIEFGGNDTGVGSVYLFTIADTQDVIFTSNINADDNAGEYLYKFFRLEGTTYVPVGGFHTEGAINHDLTSDIFQIRDLPPGDYYVKLRTFNIPPPNIFNSGQIYAHYKTRNSNNYKFLYGGGNRIARIGYFKDSTVPKNYYQESAATLLPEKEKIYDYSLIANAVKSSGSLAYSVPKFEYNKYKQECWYCQVANTQGSGGGAVIYKDDQGGYFYNLITTFNNLNPIKTQGADIGYKNVTVKETGNGRTEFEYTSPITDPEVLDVLNTASPFLPTKNIDYRRGLLKKETVFDQSSKPLTETVLDYDFEESVAVTGFRTYYNYTDFINIMNHTYYTAYKAYIESCSQHPAFIDEEGCDPTIFTGESCDCFCYFGTPRDFTLYKFIEEAFGWAKLKTKTTKNYFYPGSATSPTIFTQTDEAFTYNSVNKGISEHTVTNSKGEVLKTKYFYHTGNSAVSQNRIAEIERIESYRGINLLSTSKIMYANTFGANASYFPQTIQTAKAAASLEERVQYNLYNEFGNPTELQKENGTVVSYIWGYNKSQPIAKIENATNAQIATALGVSLATVDETDLTAINNLRVTLPNAMITTYSYRPLVGVSTITDPKGYKATYEYDSLGRLKVVRDAYGNKVSENEYNYRTQN
jgi:YD repeat-containing protein